MALTLQSHAEQVADHLKGELLRQRWVDTLPGIRRLEQEFGVNHNMIESALRILQDEGILEDQGHGKPRRIILPRRRAGKRQARIRILLYESMDRGMPAKVELMARLREAGHETEFATKSLHDLKMDVAAVARFVGRNPADAWIVSAGSREVLEWFASQPVPAMAMFGRFSGLPIAAVSPRKSPALAMAVRKLVKLGHHRIVMISREERLKPQPALYERNFLRELESHGLETGRYNLPIWNDSMAGFQACLDSLFRDTPPTAMLVNEPPLFLAAHQYLARRHILVPEQVSLICDDPSPCFAWWSPTVSHIRWDSRLIARRVLEWVNHVARGRKDLKQTLIPATFVDGGTIGPAPTTG